MSPLPPIETVALFPQLARKLLELLKALAPADWERGTVLPSWRVKDVVAHLVDTALRRLSGGRDGYRPTAKSPAITSYEDLVRHVGAIADQWVEAARGLSPAVLIELLERLEPQLYAYLGSLDPTAQARVPVAWAGEARSANWFDTAREYTERWHHQMQIREAFGDRTIQEPSLYRPVLETFMRALPHHYRGLGAAEGSIIRVTVAGDAGGSWRLLREDGAWQLSAGPQGREIAFAEVRQESAWKIFTRFGRETVPREHVLTGGDQALARHVLSMVCIIA